MRFPDKFCKIFGCTVQEQLAREVEHGQGHSLVDMLEENMYVLVSSLPHLVRAAGQLRKTFVCFSKFIAELFVG